MKTIVRSPVFIVSVLASVVVVASELMAGEATSRLVLVALIPVGYGLVVTLLARRSETASVLAGRPADERWQQMSFEASTLALGVSAAVVIVAFAIVRATAGDAMPYAFIGAVMAVAYLGSVALIRVRN